MRGSRRVVAGLALAFALLPTRCALALTGGPDEGGYFFIDSDEPGGPVYVWLDVNWTGTETGLGNGGEYNLELPFTFYYYGMPVTAVTIEDNGTLLMRPDEEMDATNDCMPHDNIHGTESIVAPLWEDLDCGDSDGVYYQHLGTAPDRCTVIHWHNVANNDGNADYYDFQVLLYEAESQIVFQYKTVTTGTPGLSNGGGASVGIQRDVDVGLDYSCNTDTILHDELAVLFYTTCTDDDGDGVDTCSGDCDDTEATVYEGAAEVHDVLDNDCDGFVDEDFVGFGDIVISEFMNRPASEDQDQGEWFEVHNPTAVDVNLIGWEISQADGGDDDLIYTDVIVPAGGYAILARNDDPANNGNLPWVDYRYDDFNLYIYSPDSIMLGRDGTEIDRVEYTTLWPYQASASAFLDPAAYDADLNDLIYAWCTTPSDGAHDFGGLGGYGTPGAENPPGQCCDVDADGDGYTICMGDCDDDDPLIYLGQPEVQDADDNDCDGLADEDFVNPGDVVITEFMHRPAAGDYDAGQWIEVFNATAADINLLGWALSRSDGGDDDLVADDLVVPAGGYALFASDADAADNGNLPPVDFVFTDFNFDPHADSMMLSMGGTAIDTVEFSEDAGWVFEDGTSVYLDPGAYDAAYNDGLLAWCLSPTDGTHDFGGLGDHGTPGADNPAGVCCDFDDDGDGHTVCMGDCEDADPAVNPAEIEVCDGVDNDCDESNDEAGDPDGDGWTLCAGDCDDHDDDTYPGAGEDCDGVDNDCDGTLALDEVDDDGDGAMACDECDDTDADLNPDDADGDGYSSCDGDCDDADPALNLDDADGDNWSTCDGDCDDTDTAFNPGQAEICGDGIDQDCTGAADDVDGDGDGFIHAACDGGDCDDTDPLVHPGAYEDCFDGVDNDCDGFADAADPEMECPGDDDDDDSAGDDDDSAAADDDDSAVADDDVADDDDAEDDPGCCECRTGEGRGSAGLAIALALVLVGRRRP